MGTLEQGVWTENCLGWELCPAFNDGYLPYHPLFQEHAERTLRGSATASVRLVRTWIVPGTLFTSASRSWGFERMEAIQPPKDWSTSHHGGPRTIVREDVRLETGK